MVKPGYEPINRIHRVVSSLQIGHLVKIAWLKITLFPIWNHFTKYIKMLSVANLFFAIKNAKIVMSIISTAHYPALGMNDYGSTF